MCSLGDLVQNTRVKSKHGANEWCQARFKNASRAGILKRSTHEGVVRQSGLPFLSATLLVTVFLCGTRNSVSRISSAEHAYTCGQAC